jgi:hypothetical protein
VVFGIQTLQPIAFLGTALIVRLYWNDNKAIMDKFLTQPPKKKPKTDAEKQEKAKEYEQQRERSFQNAWAAEYKWVLYDKATKRMYCNICRAVYGPLAKKPKHTISAKFQKYVAGPLVVGCGNMKKIVLKGHEASEGHILADEKQNISNKPMAEAPARKMIKTLNEASFSKLEILFRNAHSVAMKNRPLSDYEWLCTLDMKKGLDIGKTYRGDKACASFVKAIAEHERLKIEKRIGEASFLSIMSDGSQDVSVLENEIVFVRTVQKGVSETFFVGLIHVPKANARGIFNALKRALTFQEESADDVLKKCVGFTCDGAAVNTGADNGVIGIMHEELSDRIVLVHCLVHRLELA